MHAWRIIPFAVVIFLAGLASIPKEVDDAAAIDGATGFKKFWSVTLPLQLPIATVALLFGIVFTATDMAIVYILTQGGPPHLSTEMVTTWAYKTGIQAGSLGPGAAISLFLLPVLAVVSDRDAALRAAGGGHRSADRRREGPLLSVVGPFAIVLAFPFYGMVITAFKNRTDLYDPSRPPFWFGKRSPTWDNASYLFHQTQYPRWLANTALVGVCVVAITLVLAVPAGYALARLSGRVGPEPRRRHLPHLPCSADAALHAAVLGDHQVHLQDSTLVARPRLSRRSPSLSRRGC